MGEPAPAQSEFELFGREVWPIWRMLGWGIGVVAHGIIVLVDPEERIEREVRVRRS